MKTQRFSLGQQILTLFLFVGLVGLLPACSSDDSTAPPAAPPGPQVLLVTPGDLESGVNVQQHVVVTFDQPLDASQNLIPLITLTDPSGTPLTTVTGVTRPTANSIDVANTGLPQGAEVWVTLNERIKGSNGSEMGSPYTWTYWTQSSQPLFLRGLPLHESTDVPTNTQIFLLFSEEMNLLSANTKILLQKTLPDPLGQGPFPLGFTATRGEDAWLVLTPNSELDTESTIRVTIPADLETEVGGRTLGIQSALSFITGTVGDTTPPKLISMDPANGAVISPDRAYITFSFDEPINTDTFVPSLLGAQFYLLLENAPSSIQWTENFTVLTVPLPTPMPAGMPLRALFDSFEDFAGNVTSEALDYSISVEGVADYYPFVDGLQFGFETARYWKESAMGPVMGPEFRTSYQGMRRESSDVWNRVEYTDDSFDTAHNWDILGRTSSDVLLQGFTDDDEGILVTTTLSPAVEWLKLPPSAQSWSGSSVATNSEGSVTIDYQAELVQQEDLPLFPPGFEVPTKRSWIHSTKRAEEPDIVWLDCWMWTLDYTMTQGETVVSSGNDTLWYAPSVGIVWDRGSEEDSDGSWSWTQEYLGYLNLTRPPTTQD